MIHHPMQVIQFVYLTKKIAMKGVLNTKRNIAKHNISFKTTKGNNLHQIRPRVTVTDCPKIAVSKKVLTKS